MKKYFVFIGLSLILSACATDSTQMYGTISGGVESSKVF